MFKRTLSLLLCLLVAVPSLAFCAFAQENEVSPAEISYEICGCRLGQLGNIQGSAAHPEQRERRLSADPRSR